MARPAEASIPRAAAPPDGPRAADPFVGRRAACGLLENLVASGTARGAAHVVAGNAGIGRTALLQEISRRSPVPVLRLNGRPDETAVPWATAADLLSPLRHHAAELPAAQRRAVDVALALAPGPAPAALAVRVGALAMLAAAAASQPLLVVVDDLQWVDAESRRLLTFVARRIGEHPVVMLFGWRREPGAPVPDEGLPVLLLGGLSPAEALELVQSRDLDASPRTVRDLVRATGGNPSALLETLLHGPPDVPTLPGATGVRPGGSVERAWLGVLEQLPSRTRHALFVVAVATTRPGIPLPALLGDLGLSLEDLAPAERQGLLVTAGQRLEMSDPLLLPVLVGAIPLAVRRSTYRAAADRADPQQRAWFLSEAALGHDDRVSAELGAAASDAEQRGDPETAAGLWRRAADLTAGQGTRAERMLAAARDALSAGRAEDAERWCDLALANRSDATFVAATTLVRSAAVSSTGHPTRAADELGRAAEAVRPQDPVAAAELLCEAILPTAMAGDIRNLSAAAGRARAALSSSGAPGSFHAAATTAVADVLAGHTVAGRRGLDEACALLNDADLVRRPHVLVALVQGRTWTEDFDAARRLATRSVDLLRRNGSRAQLAAALAVRCEIGYWTGHWADAYADGSASLRRAEELLLRGTVGSGLVALARIDAARGERALCRSRVERARRDAGPYGLASLSVSGPAALGLAELGAGDPGLAAEHLDEAWRNALRLGVANPVVVPFVGDLVEAQIRCGQDGAAREVLEWLAERAAGTRLAYAGAALHRGRGLLATDVTRALAEFAVARRLCPLRATPFEYARTLLCEGEVLRRARRPQEARARLREAEHVFRTLGAVPWADRAAGELAASGDRTATPRPTGDLERLTAHEVQVGRLVAAGRSNTEIATSLFVSRKTVEAHLTRIYRKLGIRSRNELTRLVLARDPAT